MIRHAIACAGLTLALVACKKQVAADLPPAEEPEPALLASAPTSAVEADASAVSPRVVLVTIDGVRWQDVFDGADPAFAPRGAMLSYVDPDLLVPNLRALAQKGVAFGGDEPGCGVVVRAHGTSNISLPGYLEILGGHATSCRSNACATTLVPTVLDAAAREGVTPVASIASWETVGRAASSGAGEVGGSLIVAAGARPWPSPLGATRLAELTAAGARSGPFPAQDGHYRPDAMTMRIALEYLRAESPRLLHVALGDADEHAHRGDYMAYLDAIHYADRFVGDVVETLEDEGRLEDTTVLVTADHGRAKNFRDHGPSFPESRRSFLFAFGRGVASTGARCASRDIELTDVGATVRALLDLPVDGASDAGLAVAEIAGNTGQKERAIE